MPRRVEDIRREGKLHIFSEFKNLPPREFIKKSIVVFWYGMTGKDLPASGDKDNKPQSK